MPTLKKLNYFFHDKVALLFRRCSEHGTYEQRLFKTIQKNIWPDNKLLKILMFENIITNTACFARHFCMF